ncbi:glycosyltransferase family 2 protein [Rhizobium panacihumi]|uniref:glycosyltransferase family 2 protein n=1 Tax=Rhizobium panacihumi TaxID=2008450 RepID=UPI003D79883F
MTKIGIRRRIIVYIKKKLGISLGLFHLYEGPLIRQPEAHTATQTSNNQPMISVVTPSYNQGHFIAATINSVVGQNYSSLEYIIQDACSTDETATIIATFGWTCLQAYYEEDHGQADAIARGFSRSSGDIMCYLNSDDLMMPNTLQRVADFFHDHPQVDVVYGDRLVIDENDRIVGDWRLPDHAENVTYLVDYVPQETLFWRRRIWDKVGGIDTSLQFAMDWDLILRFQAAGAQIHHLPEFLGAFRVHASQKTHSAINVGKQEMALVRRRYTTRLRRLLLQVPHILYLARHIQINRRPIKWYD